MGCCDRRLARDVKQGTVPRRIITGQTVRCPLGYTVIELQRDYGAPRPFYGPGTGNRYEFGGRRRAGAVDNSDLRSEDPKRPGLLDLLDAAGALFAVA